MWIICTCVHTHTHTHPWEPRQDLERFIASFNALMEHTSHVEQQLHMQGAEGEGGDVETAEDALTRHIQIHDQLRKAPQSTIREGNELLRRLEQVRLHHLAVRHGATLLL